MQTGRFTGSLMIILVVALFGGCGGSNSETSPVKPGSNVPKGGTVETAKVLERVQKGIPAQRGQWMVDIGVDPGGDFAYTVAKVIAPRGNTNFRLVNPQAEFHDLAIEEVGGGRLKTPKVRDGSRWVRASLYLGKKFVFYCTVPGHREAGMEGIVKVDPFLEADDLKPF
ncbi:MAG TPA: hypothetical protein VKA35_01455 [Solirubrobacterales bacterium]|nr:hypothetical protein [Solirubrobacterales bacterium]